MADGAGPSARSDEWLDELWEARWEAVCATPGVVRTSSIDDTRRRPLGRLGVQVQFNETHQTNKRPSTMDLTPEKLSVVRPFNPAGFHFNKAKPAETLFWVAADGSVVVAPEAAPTAETDATPTERPSTTPSSAPSSGLEHRLLINVSPLVGLHSLFCPFVARELPQVLTPDSLLAALQFLRRFRRTDAKLLFNSLGAWSSVNHLHFHLVVPAPAFPEGTFPVERAERRELARAPARAPAPAEAEADAPCTLTLHDLHGWPLRSLVIERRGGGDRDGSGADDRASAMVAKLWPLVEDLLERGVPHNMLIADAGATVYLMPRRVQSIVAGGAINIAIAEACGLGIVYNEETFESFDADLYEDVLRQTALSEADFGTLAEAAAAVFGRESGRAE